MDDGARHERDGPRLAGVVKGAGHHLAVDANVAVVEDGHFVQDVNVLALVVHLASEARAGGVGEWVGGKRGRESRKAAQGPGAMLCCACSAARAAPPTFSIVEHLSMSGCHSFQMGLSL